MPEPDFSSSVLPETAGSRPRQGAAPAAGRAEKWSLLRMEFSTFCVAWIQVPCQVVRTSRRVVFRLLSWNPWQGVFLRLMERLHGARLC